MMALVEQLFHQAAQRRSNAKLEFFNTDTSSTQLSRLSNVALRKRILSNAETQRNNEAKKQKGEKREFGKNKETFILMLSIQKKTQQDLRKMF